jgi:hypothetical protein
MLDDTFQGNQFTEYGNEHEDHAAQLSRVAFQEGWGPQYNGPAYKSSGEGCEQLWLEECPLVVHDKHPYLAYSADGLWHQLGQLPVLNEIKCPRQMYPCIPLSHYCQITMGCALMNTQEISYNVYLPEAVFMHKYKFDQEFWDEYLLPALEDAFYNFLLPRLILRDKGILGPGELYPLTHRIPAMLKHASAKFISSTTIEDKGDDRIGDDQDAVQDQEHEHNTHLPVLKVNLDYLYFNRGASLPGSAEMKENQPMENHVCTEKELVRMFVTLPDKKQN